MRFPLLVVTALTLHYGFLGFLIGGGFLAQRWPRLGWLHLAAAGWSAAILAVGQPCPLTVLEDWARGPGSSGAFIDRHVTGVLYPATWEPGVQALVAGAVLVSWGLLLRQRAARSWSSSQLLRSSPPP